MKKTDKKNSRFSIEYQMEKFNLTEEEAIEKIKIMRFNCGKSMNIEYQMEKFNLTEEEAIEKISKIKKSYGHNIFSKEEWMSKGYSEEEAIEKINEIKYKNKKSLNDNIAKLSKFDKRARSNKTKEYWIKKGYDEIEAINMAKKEGDKMRDAFYEKLSVDNQWFKDTCNTTIQYYLNLGYNEEEAKILLNKRQTTFSKEKCIQKYGIDDGIRIFNERQIKWQNTLNSKSDEEQKNINQNKDSNSLSFYVNKYGYDIGNELYKESCEKNRHRNKREGYIEKYGDEVGNELYNQRIEKIFRNRKKSGMASMESLKVFKLLYTYCRNKKINRNDIYVGAFGRYEYSLRDSAGRFIYLYDFYIKPLNLVIEYNGSCFHPDYRKLDMEDIKKWVSVFGVDGMTCYNKEMDKLNTLTKNNIDYIVLWDDIDHIQNFEICKNEVDKRIGIFKNE